ncbi:MAG: hypothetical protein KDG89_15380 [Geminicoccaceae bacterium]|nr:hypothetical protein [Geminicoccaceae bacterium]
MMTRRTAFPIKTGRKNRGGAALMASLLLAGTAAAPAARADEVRGAVFTMSDSAVLGNAVVAYRRLDDGALRQAGVYPTGGIGAGPAPTSTVLGSPVPATADGLGSQNSLILSHDRRLLFAVNAGSDSVSCLRVNGTFRSGPLLSAARTVHSGGIFPASLTWRGGADGGGVLYVLNAGKEGNITGFRVTPDCAMRRIQGGRSGALNALTDDPPFPSPAPNEVLTTAAQVGFTPDGTRLVVTIKGGLGSGKLLDGGDVAVFRILASGAIAAEPTVTHFSGVTKTAGPFSFVFDAHGNLLLNHANSFTFASYRIGDDGALAPVGKPVPISGLKDGSILAFGGFNCWVARRGNTVYVMTFGDLPATNGGLPDGPGVISGLKVADDGALGLLPVVKGRAKGVVAVLPQDDRDGPRPRVVGNHGIDLAVVEDGGRAFLYAIEPRLGQIGAWKVKPDGTLGFVGDFSRNLIDGVDPFAGTNPGINKFRKRCYLQDGRLSPACRLGSAQGLAGF